MELGCHLPVYGAAARRDTLLGFARRMEGLGYDSLWVSDHIVLPRAVASKYPYSATGAFPLEPDTPFLEPLTALALVAGATERIRLGTSVLVLPHRHPVLLAKMLATLDRLAPGRVIAGVGVGWMREEIELLGSPYDRRGAWSDEALAVLRTCWTEASPRFDGRFFRFPEVGFSPQPGPGAIPIWIGGDTPAALRRVARYGDGWQAAFPTAAELAPALERLRAACRAEGRDPGAVTLSVRVGLPARQSSEEILDTARALRDLGVTHLVFESRARELDAMAELYERVARDVRPRL